MTMKNRGFCRACRIDHTKGPLYRSKVDGNLYCIWHYNQMFKFGKITSIKKIYSRFKPNRAVNYGDYVEIILEDRNKNEIARTKVDISDYGKVVQHRWFLSRRGYVRAKFMREGKWCRLRLHSFLLRKKEGFISDHIDGDTLNNRSANLRHVTHAQSSWNTSHVKNYKAYKVKDKFVCKFQYNNQIISLGKWSTREEAIDIAEKFQTFLHGNYSYDKSRIRT